MKQCAKCRELKPVEMFSKDKTRPDGRNYCCKICHSARNRKYNAENPEARYLRNKSWRQRNPDKCAQYIATYVTRNPEKVKETQANYRERNRERERTRGRIYKALNAETIRAKAAEYRAKFPEKVRASYRAYEKANLEKRKAKNVDYAKRNPDKISAKAARRRATKLQATPKWADDAILKAWYMYAESMSGATGVKYHVDHIVPLKSEIVCGLHCESNLQILPGVENVAKNNRYWPDMPV